MESGISRFDDWKLKRFWCAVACREHVKLGIAGGFTQVGHGKRGPLERMMLGDGIVYYSPTETMGGVQKCQMFTSIGLIKDRRIYQFEMSPGFTPYRRDVFYFDAQDTPIKPLLASLSFTRDQRRWGYKFQFGLFEIERNDFALILSRMNPGLAAKFNVARG
ncbi:EVE domain-containing protein [Mesorhizobium helmanticense]|uniref:UPF0310 protein C9427_30500 n=1 Tax=Mesorhizobium helmanticense TaxID=1776423 RepID=A0A2T4IM14_9HYPH|nr:EVE domain-containing protein [Mesorhizobium helmanticense]PTE06660.1 EVE domain-containing protein [Mesorhizobium helmanticense]